MDDIDKLKELFDLIKNVPWHYDLGLEQPNITAMMYHPTRIPPWPCATISFNKIVTSGSIVFRENRRPFRDYKNLPASYSVNTTYISYDWNYPKSVSFYKSKETIHLEKSSTTRTYFLIDREIGGDLARDFECWCQDNDININSALSDEDHILIRMKWG